MLLNINILFNNRQLKKIYLKFIIIYKATIKIAQKNNI